MADDGGNLKRRVDNVLQRISSMDLRPCGDLFSTDLSEVDKTVDCLEDLLNKIVAGFDFRIGAQSQITSLTFDNKTLNSKINNLKKQFLDEIQGLKEKTKNLQVALQDKKKEALGIKQEYDTEKSAWENKLKQLNNELRKKENSIKALTDKAVANSIKGGKVINNFEAIGDIPRPGRNFYKDKSIDELLVGNIRHKELLSENSELKELLKDCSETLVEALKKRKILLSSMETEAEGSLMRGTYLEIKEDLHNLSLSDFKSVGLVAMRENLKLLFNIFDKIDAFKTRVPLAAFTSGFPDAEVDGLHEIGQIRDVAKQYKSIVETQRKLIRTAIYNKEYDKIIDPIPDSGPFLTGTGYHDRSKELASFKDRLFKTKEDFKSFSNMIPTMIPERPQSSSKFQPSIF